jgi:hypothetical protein
MIHTVVVHAALRAEDAKKATINSGLCGGRYIILMKAVV